MKTRRTSLLLTAFLALLALPLIAQPPAGNRGPRDPESILHNPRALARYLKLTPDQVTATQKLFDELRATVEPLRKAQEGLRDDLRDELEAASPNACTVGQAALAVHANQERIKDAFEAFDTKFSALLTPEQLAKYEALKEAARALRGEDE
ncbi:MAG: Spy/CpxP family protein refolding chaperone [Thermoanaerobaculia bacterium]